MKPNKINERFIALTKGVEFKAVIDESTGKASVTGYAALYNSNSREMVGYDQQGTPVKFIERIASGAFDGCDFSECIFNLEHDRNRVVARTGRNLAITPDEIGLAFSVQFDVENKNTSEQKDFLLNVQQGLINQCSFQGHVAEDDISYEGETIIRTIKKIDYCLDLCGTVMGVYPETYLTKRTFESLPEPAKVETVEVPTEQLNELEVLILTSRF